MASVCFSNKDRNWVNWELTRDSNLLTTVSTLVETMVEDDKVGGAAVEDGDGVMGAGEDGGGAGVAGMYLTDYLDEVKRVYR